MIREQIKQALVGAMKAGDAPRRDAIRLIQSALKNRDIELRGAANPPEDDVLVMEVLQKMIKQRRESIEIQSSVRGVVPRTRAGPSVSAAITVLRSHQPARTPPRTSESAVSNPLIPKAAWSYSTSFFTLACGA